MIGLSLSLILSNNHVPVENFSPPVDTFFIANSANPDAARTFAIAVARCDATSFVPPTAAKSPLFSARVTYDETSAQFDR